MLGKFKKVVQLVDNMGWRYIFFRTGFELKKRTGLLKNKFPIQPQFNRAYDLESWKREVQPFFFESKEKLIFEENLTDELTKDYQKLVDFEYPFFSSLHYKLGASYDWITNPATGYRYNTALHWLDINDYDPKAGDIKFVWEPSRFSHLYTIIRYDKHAGVDCSKHVFDEIERWIAANPINQGPNFKCSQEISLRVMNWTFALYYYKNSPSLTAALFDKMQHYIYWQVEHVYHNINFSRIAVRNNHAITETLLLYMAGLLFPKFKGAENWKNKGKAWFEQEIAYQIYEDGSFLQFSMNYHRVVVQLLTWALNLSAVNHEAFAPVVYERAKKSLDFLVNHMNTNTGWLPNYGNNDGALFFKLSNAHYRDYRPQLEALSYALGMNWDSQKFEDAKWYGIKNRLEIPVIANEGFTAFEKGGYYLYRTNESLSFIRCGNHKDRPAQADNLHLDIWYKDKNLLHDAGSYKYNADQKDLKYFMGTQSHNTVMLGDFDQMEKGARFIWYNWSQCKSVRTEETDEYFIFEGEINCFKHINPAIMYKRKVKIYKEEPVWEIEDHMLHKPKDLILKQLWHTAFPELLTFLSATINNEPIDARFTEGYVADFYGVKANCTEVSFETYNDTIKTIIGVKS
ncbi:heparinase II/III family protein [Pedobacter sp. Du54]|uniref:heparinase II/III domain-containing protein n=1 Tax=Pedobacter anseongensis TaxID=3133439 RepID=UPI0030AF1680